MIETTLVFVHRALIPNQKPSKWFLNFKKVCDIIKGFEMIGHHGHIESKQIYIYKPKSFKVYRFISSNKSTKWLRVRKVATLYRAYLKVTDQSYVGGKIESRTILV